MKKKNTQPIGVFDSGVGGLSVLRELKRIIPHENFVFLADQLYVPYGEKSKKELVQLGLRVTNYFVKNHDIKMMVVACNTSTCNSVDEVRKKYSLPIVGTVPAIKPAAERTKSGIVAIISTPATSKSGALRKLIKDHCRGVKVLNVGCKNLENAVEKGELESAEINRLLAKYLSRIKNSNADKLVLGCTHYPFLKKPIRKILGSSVKLLDGNKAIAKRAKTLLLKHFLKNKQKKLGKTLYFSTDDPVKFSQVASKLLKKKIQTKKVKI